jgi:Fe-S cluster assembly protein SufB
MSIAAETKQQVAEIGEKYKYGFVTDIEMDMAPKGLSEDTVRFISAKKGEPEWMLEWRLGAFRRWLTMKEPNWARVHYPKIDYQNAYYYAAPKNTPLKQSLDEVDPKLLETYKKLGIPLHEQMALAGVAVDAVFDSVSVATTFKEKLNEAGVIFCPISEAIRDYPESGEEVSGHGGAGDGQFLRHPEFGGLFRRHVRLCAQGCALSDGAVDLFPHQCVGNRAVRTHHHHCRRR